MSAPRDNRSVALFDAQFRECHEGAALALNPFELAVLPHLEGRVLDMGCGLGNLALAACGRGCEVVAVDASDAGIACLCERARRGSAKLEAVLADARSFDPGVQFDAVVSIGLLMFIECPTARRLLERWKGWVRPGGVMAVNVLVEGTTYLDMFEPDDHCLWKPADLDAAFSGWEMRHAHDQEFPAPGGTVKRFRTVVAKKGVGARFER